MNSASMIAMPAGAAAVLLCLLLGDDRRAVSAWVGTITMAAAMVDMALGMLPAVLWSGLLIGAGLVVAVRSRKGPGLHRALGLILMAPLVLFVAHGSEGMPAHHGTGSLIPLMVTAVAVFVGYAFRLAFSRCAADAKASTVWSRTEAVVDACLLAAMAIDAVTP